MAQKKTELLNLWHNNVALSKTPRIIFQVRNLIKELIFTSYI